jgi:hypothetical protein
MCQNKFEAKNVNKKMKKIGNVNLYIYKLSQPKKLILKLIEKYLKNKVSVIGSWTSPPWYVNEPKNKMVFEKETCSYFLGI